MKKLLCILPLLMLFVGCGNNTSKTNVENNDSLVQLVPADENEIIPTDNDPNLAILDQKVLDSVRTILVKSPIEQYLKKWIRVNEDSAGRYILQPSDGQIPYIQIDKVKGNYQLTLGELQMLWISMIIDFKVTDKEMMLKVVPWNEENQRYDASTEAYKPRNIFYTFPEGNSSLLSTNHDELYVESEIAKTYRLVEEPESFIEP